MRFFQPLSQHGFARILAETRTNYKLSPGLISIEKPENPIGYSSFFDIPFPPEYSHIEEANYSLKWIIPEEKKSKALANSFLLSEQPFYPSYISPTISQEDFEEYIKRFLSYKEIENQIFTLPISYRDSPLLYKVIKTDCSFFILTGLPDLFN
ncbi:MAG: hypothetical protein ACXABK_07020, partial [Candidatus Heimdallarchaeaceae archaeon]